MYDKATIKVGILQAWSKPWLQWNYVGETIRDAARVFNVPPSTLHDSVTGK